VQEISNCAAHYKANLCGSNPVPAMLRQCGAWETCMNRDPTVVGRAKVGAELIAEVINGFVEPISWKTLVGRILVTLIPGTERNGQFVSPHPGLYVVLTCFHDNFRQFSTFPLSLETFNPRAGSGPATAAIFTPATATLPPAAGA
jgi:Di-sulfide bridge nucleocytoplasmic transport domain